MLNKKYSHKFNRRISFLWGLAEATIFFIVADVFLSYLAIKNNTKNIFVYCIYCATASTLGGIVMYVFASYYYESAHNLIVNIPLISENTLIKAQNILKNASTYKIFLSGFSGIPYKVFAVQASQTSTSLIFFILVSFFARLGRFLFTALIFKICITVLRRKISDKSLIRFHLVFWIIFYINYAILTI